MKIKREKSVNEYITKALFELMKEKNYNDISITEITNKAGVGRVSFYRNFNSKEDIIEKWITFITTSFLENSNINFEKDSLEEYFVKLFSHLEKYKEESLLIYNANLIYLLKKEFENRFLNINQSKYNNYKSYFLIGGIFNVYYYWLIGGCKETSQELSRKLVNLMQK